MKLGLGKQIVLLLLPMIAIFAGCKNTEQPEPGISSMLIFGSFSNNEFVELQPTPDGGFVVGLNSFNKGSQDMRIRKYSADFKLEWEQIFGGISTDFLNHIRVDQDKIVVAGTVLGYGLDTLQRSQFRDIYLYYRAFAFNGTTLWETPFKFLQEGPFMANYESIVAQNSDQLVVVREDEYARISGLMALKADGSWDRFFTSLQMDYGSVFETDDAYVVHFCSRERDQAGFASIDKSFKHYEEDNYITQPSTTIWPWQNLVYDDVGVVGRLKNTTSDGKLQVNYILKDEAYRYEFDPTTNKTLLHTLSLPFQDVLSVNRLDNGHFLIAQGDGKVFETDSEFNIESSFQSDASVFESTVINHFVTRLKGGGYIIGFEKDRVMHLVRYDEKGKLVVH